MLTYIATIITLVGVAVAKRSLEVSLSAPLASKDVSNLKITAAFINHGDETLTLLRDPDTLLLDIPTAKTFTVSSTAGLAPSFIGVRAIYDAQLAVQMSYGDAVTILAPGETYKVVHDVGHYYNFTSTGASAYTFNPSNHLTIIEEDGSFSDLKVSTKPITITISGQLSSSMIPAETSGGLYKRVTYDTCTSSQIAAVAAAVPIAQTYAQNAVDDLVASPNGNANWVKWFGTFSSTRRTQALGEYRSMAADIPGYTFYCGCTSTVVIAFVGNTYGRQTLCTAYFTLIPATGHRSQADTIIHEASHQLLNTVDNGYGVEFCVATALSDPAKAFSTTDCHARFAVEA